MKIASLKIDARRWPWQPGYNWRGREGQMSPLGRFGGGWKFCLGLEIGSRSFILNCGFGLISCSWGHK